jgi:glycosyltransferase involved in cell wall biosynthesis
MRGGAETHLSQVLPELAARGHAVSVFVAGPFGPIAEDLTRAGVAVVPERPVAVPCGAPRWLRVLIRYAQLTARFLPFALRHRHGVLHFFLPEAIIFAGLLTIGWHKRLVASQRSLFSYRAKYAAFVTWVERLVLRHVNLILVNSACVARLVAQDGVAAERIRLLYSGLSEARLNPAEADRNRLRAALGIAPDTFVIVTVANLFPYKGHADLLAALGSLQAERALGADWALVCIGRDVGQDGTELMHRRSGSNQGRLTRLAEGLGLAPHVRFLGERADAPALLRIADLAVLASHEEGFSNALIEKMAAGLPIVATAVGGNGEALDDGRLGLLVAPRDPAALAAAIRQLFESPHMRAELSVRARARAVAGYSIARCVDEYEAAYAELFAEPRTAARAELPEAPLRPRNSPFL